MKKGIALLLAVFMITLLAGCGISNERTNQNAAESNETLAQAETDTPDYDDPSWTPTEAADPVITERVANPEDDPRMIVQVNWKPDRYAFIDQYNLIGYSYENTQGKDGADYYLDENYDYIPKTNAYLSFFTPATGEKGYKVSDGDAFVDLEGWANSYNINVSEMSLDGTAFRIETTSGKVFCIDREYYTYSVPKDGGGKVHWHFYTRYNNNSGEPIYGAAFGEKHQISNSMGVMWAIEQGFKALENDYAGNPW